MNVEDALKLLKPEQVVRLRFAFEQRMPDYVTVVLNGEAWFVGVHMDQMPTMLPLHSSGYWSTGKVS